MKRDPRLRSLSSDHHRALVMARKMDRVSRADEIDLAVLDEIMSFCRDELEPHFTREEEFLLPALEKHGEHKLVEQTLSEHAQMMELATRLEQKDALQQFAQLLKEHVRFEELNLFETSQQKLSDAELDAVEAANQLLSATRLNTV